MSEVKGTKALELWCKRLVKDCPDVQIDNMTTSWRNGMAFCALVHHFRPDLIDVSKLNPENIYENNKLAYSIAEKHLGIPSLLDPEDMVENEIPDRLSILTYLSQFYQRLGHTVNTKSSESEPKVSSSSTNQATTPIKFGKVALDKCAACGLPVYLAQRLMVSQKLYHRSCFRCSKCSGHLNPKNYHIIDNSEFSCDTCKNDKNSPKLFNNNDQIGMLAFSGDANSGQGLKYEQPVSTKTLPRPQSILEKINMFEKNIEKDDSIHDKIGNISLKNNYNDKCNDNEVFISSDVLKTANINSLDIKTINQEFDLAPKEDSNLQLDSGNIYKNIPKKTYTSSKDKFDFLQTQLSDDTLDSEVTINNQKENSPVHIKDDCVTNDELTSPEQNGISNNLEAESNITDDNRLAQNNCIPSNVDTPLPSNELTKNEQEISISVPPRRKKQSLIDKKLDSIPGDVGNSSIKESIHSPIKPVEEYPDNLNPFSDDDDDDEEERDKTEMPRRVSTNPFGSSEEEEDDEVPPIQPPPKIPDLQSSTPMKKLIKAYNPFWSDGEEPSSEEETCDESSSMHKSSVTTSTPNLPASTPRRKPKAPPPPAVIAEYLDVPSTSMDDVASISSFSSHTSTIHSDQKSFGKSTPKLKKKRPAPTPPDSLSTLSGCGESMEKGVDLSDVRNTSDGGRRVKGPAPGLPLPERREVKMQMSPEQLQVQLDMLETQQLGLERQGVLIERMIRDKCDDGPTAPQEEIEDLVIQLCELVNEKNDLFRKQTELMYIRRQQRLEQEQADIEHEIRVLQSRPAVNRIDADKVREEQLVSRLVQIVRLRDELVQQLDAERRRERQEDRAIAASIASKRAQRNSESNSSSMKSADAVAPVKKNKVKDKVKKQLKKAKHTLISKKKDDEKTEKDKEKTEKGKEKAEKDKKPK
ncbi:MICAL-like protein 1 isoform X2 [Bicyclus anynana]|uniref:MICAL-like protein 1 isoform X2 n=1 Tax=Bicyclus anynana TaxID=110368 RepID=A0ABM3LEK5_BICAN|nr:MICAL-like protein 1 isoform X2 [Bicyclus anynana]